MTADLPEPVRRFLKQAIPPGAPSPKVVRVQQHGQFLVRPPAGWTPFRAWQTFTVQPPSFVWSAKIGAVLVRDSFAAGRGATRARLFGVWPIVSMEGAGVIAVAALQRFLAEMVWFPSALTGVVWSAIDRASARATVVADGVTASLDFRFGEDGMVREVFTPERARFVGKELIPTPWRGRHMEYREMGGFVIPTRAEVEWVLPEGPQPYWRGTIDEVQHDPAI